MELRSLAILAVIMVIIFNNGVVCRAQGRKTTPKHKGQGNDNDDGVLGTLKNGFKMARKMLGLDTASGVANLVAEAFKTTEKYTSNQSPDEEDSWGKTLLSGLMRTLSLDSGRIGAIVVNAIIFLAQLLTTSIVPKNHAISESPRNVRDGSPIEWVLQNPSDSLKTLIDAAANDNLIDSLVDIIQENSKDKDTSCIQLLICKLAPFVKRMQKVLSNLKLKFEKRANVGANIRGNTSNSESMDRESNKTIDYGENHNDDIKNGDKIIVNDDARSDDHPLFRHLPEVQEFIEHGRVCESKYQLCRLGT